MATHASFEPGLKADLHVPGAPAAALAEPPASERRGSAAQPLQWKPAADAAPTGNVSLPDAPTQPAVTRGRMRRTMRRTMTREQGCALEMIGHAVDYLNDCYLHEGADDEILDFSGPSMDAIQILISAQRQILRSLPLTEPLTMRLWHAVLRRKSQFKSSPVIPLSSSR